MQILDIPLPFLAAMRQAARGNRLAMVGGAVRDLILHRHHQDAWRGLPDIDFVVEGNAFDLVESLPEYLEKNFGILVPMRKNIHAKYGTAELDILLPKEYGGRWIVDVASARKEYYLSPASNPEVKWGTLEQDLGRRDFTINAIAIELTDKAGNGIFLDPYDGQSDIAKGQIKLLHSRSLSDDPSRLIRAARYGARLRFQPSSEALAQIELVLQVWPWDWHLGDDPRSAPPGLAVRLRKELTILLDKEPWQDGLRLLREWGALLLFDCQLQSNSHWQKRLNWCQRLSVNRLLALVANASRPIDLAARLQLPIREQFLLKQMLRLEQIVKSSELLTPSSWTQLLETPGVSPAAVALLIVRGITPRYPLVRWLNHWRYIKSPISAKSLIELGWNEGPALGLELQRRRAEFLDRTQLWRYSH